MVLADISIVRSYLSTQVGIEGGLKTQQSKPVVVSARPCL